MFKYSRCSSKNSSGIKIQVTICSETMSTYESQHTSLQRCVAGMILKGMLSSMDMNIYSDNTLIQTKPTSLFLSKLHSTHSLCSCAVWLTYKLCFLASGWVWPMGALAEIRKREESERRVFIPWLPPWRCPQGGCTLL